jgi:Glycosyl hydrolase catalytic core
MRHRGACLAVLVAAFVAATAQPVHASRYLQVGIFDEAQLLYGSAAPTLATFKTLHVQVVRMNLYWGGDDGVANAKPLHPLNPNDPAYDWSIYDNIVRQVAAEKMQIVFSIYGTPSWANGGAGQNVAPTNALDLRKFATAAAKRYSGKDVVNGSTLPAVRDWLAWNEPNNPVFLKPQYKRVGSRWVIESAVQYAKICNAIYNGVHSTGLTSERVACGVTAPRGNNDPSSSRPSVSPLAFLRAVKADGLVTFDAWAHHPYYSKPSESPSATDGADGSVELGNIDTLIKLVTKLYGNKRIWITEYGYETNPPDSIFGVSWAKQAAYLTQAFAIARANPRIDMMLWFLLRDDTNINGWQSGLITAGGQKKPSFAAFERMAGRAAARRR